MALWIVVKGGLALFMGIFVSIVILPLMANIAYGPGMEQSWTNAGETATAMRDRVIAQYQWFPIFISALVVVWMFYSANKKDPTIEETDWG